MKKLIVAIYLINYAVSDTCDPVIIGGSDSVYCRCNSTYCDTFDLDLPLSGLYQTVTSDISGARFASEVHKIDAARRTTRRSETIINLYNEEQTVRGFGGSLTDATLVNLFNLTEKARMNALKTWFGPNGAKFSVVRIPIGGADFSTYPYSLDDSVNDFQLEEFSLSDIDLNFRLPVMEIIKNISPVKVEYLASAWSAPVWLKNTDYFNGIGKLNGTPGDRYHKTWANYHVKVGVSKIK